MRLTVDRKFDVYERAYNYNREPVKHGNLRENGTRELLQRIQSWQLPIYPNVVRLAEGFGDPASELIHTIGGNLQIKWMDAALSVAQALK